ncbi:MAG: GNAT family N-acetyltransferase [Bacteroidota bacterium]
MNIEIKDGSIDDILNLSKKIPEFSYSKTRVEYEERLQGVLHLIHIAYVDGIPAAYKVGYSKEDHFYSWVGAVLPAFRRLGIARLLAEKQEAFVIKNEIQEIRFKTMNKFKGMLLMGISRGFKIIDLKKGENVSEYKILLSKKMKGAMSNSFQ